MAKKLQTPCPGEWGTTADIDGDLAIFDAETRQLIGVGATVIQTVNIVKKHNATMRIAMKALEFYANPETYHAVAFLFDPPTGGYETDFGLEHGHPGYRRPMPGKTARQASRAIDKLFKKTPLRSKQRID
jgi:hypothetical protein